MSLPPLQPVSDLDIYISGDVSIDPQATIAPGVVLQASSQGRIVIGADVCIGMGVIIHAHEGVINVDSGAILGAGVLIVGTGKIGSNACVGASTTILNASVAPMTVIKPGSVLGDRSRQIEMEVSKADDPPMSESQTAANQTQTTSIPSSPSESPTADPWSADGDLPTNNGKPNPATTQQDLSSLSEVNETQNSVVGRVYLDRIMLTLFPHRNLENGSKS